MISIRGAANARALSGTTRECSKRPGGPVAAREQRDGQLGDKRVERVVTSNQKLRRKLPRHGSCPANLFATQHTRHELLASGGDSLICQKVFLYARGPPGH